MRNDDATESTAEARALLLTALTASLATLDADGTPYASLVRTAPDMDGAPLVLVSGLARHTRNLERDPRAGLLVDRREDAGDPLTQPRLSLSGRLVRSEEARARSRFLAHHPDAAGYAGFADFSLRRMDVASAHVVAGFGRIHDPAPGELLLDLDGAAALRDGEAAAVAHVNADHADAVALYATRLAGARPADWRLAGCDPEGVTLVAGGRAIRLAFPRRVASPGELRAVLVDLAAQARNAAP